MRILVACNSFKGTMTSLEAGNLIKEEFMKKDSSNKIDVIALSDGGDGFLDVINQNISIEKYYCDAFDSLLRPIRAPYLYKNGIAYIELAEVIGIKLLKKEELSPYLANSFGLGLVIKHIIKNHDVKKIVMGIGGSASTDGGAGMLEALGAKFYYNDIKINLINNYKLGLITKVNLDDVFALTKNIYFEILTDVSNPLCGQNGSAFVFGPQKGATEQDVIEMDNNLNHFVQVVGKYRKAKEPGSGAAGGVGYGALIGFNAKLTLGIDYILKLTNFDVVSNNYDLIITGEGKFDEQSKMGKVYQGIVTHSQTKVIVLCGASTVSDNFVYPIVPNIATEEYSIKYPKDALASLIKSLNIKNN